MVKMKAFLNSVPIPTCGLILGLVALGNLMMMAGFKLPATLFFVVGLLMMVPMLLKIILLPRQTLSALHDPIAASVSPTFTMAWMLICVFLNKLFPHAPFVTWIWMAAVIIHFSLMIYFIVVHILPVKITLAQIYPSWFITFVGIGVISNTAPLFVPEVGRVVIWLALACYFLLLPAVLKRALHYQQMPEATVPLIAIVAAPGSLCLSGYLVAVQSKSVIFVSLLLVLSQVLYFAVLYFFKTMLALRFYPSYAAFTFPLVITANAMYKSYIFFGDYPTVAPILQTLFYVELGIATLAVCYVFVCYLRFFAKQFKGCAQSQLHVKV